MGFGNGYSNRTSRDGKSYNNSMTAHVWNAQSERAGHSSNGNFYFTGRALYSYGSHFVCGYIMPDGLAFLNADSYSISTSGHMSDARHAASDRRTVSVAGLTDLAGDWKLLPRLASFLDAVQSRGVTATERKEMRELVRRELRAHAAKLDSPILAPGESSYGEWDYSSGTGVYTPRDMSGHMTAGEYLAKLAGLPVATWPKLQREAAKLAADRKAADAKASATQAVSRALQLADMPNRQFRDMVANLAADYSDYQLRDIGKQLKRARGLMLKATAGKLAAKGRLAVIRERIKRVDSVVATYAEQKARRDAAKSLAHSLAIVRQWRDASPEGKAGASWHLMRNVADAAERLAKAGRLASLKASASTLQADATAAMTAIQEREAAERALERERAKLAEAERRALWLAGERVGSIRFDAESGGAALRVIGEELETSHGASVPLAHAVKAFRYIKLCRERGESFHRNGRTIRVGHFQVDSISPSGDFKAGCHHFTWPEVERVAKLAGVFDCPASDSAVEPSSVAA